MAFPHLNVFPGVTRKHSEQDRNIYVIYVYSMQNITNKRYLMTRGIISTEDGEFIQNQFTSWCGKPTGGIDQNTNLLIQFTIWGLVGWMNHTHKMAGLLRFYHIYEVSLYCMWPVVFPADFLLSCTFQSALHRRTVTWWACQNLACPWNGILRLPRTWLNESYQGWWWQAFAKGKPFTRFSAFSPFPGRCYSSLRFVIPDICAKDGPKKNNIFIHIPKRFPMSSGFTQMPKLSRNHQPQIKIFP